MSDTTFWERFAFLREQQGFHTDLEFYAAHGVSPNNQSNWRNRGVQPDTITLGELSDIFGVSMDYLGRGVIRIDADRGAARALDMAKKIAEGPGDLPRRRRRRNNAEQGNN